MSLTREQNLFSWDTTVWGQISVAVVLADHLHTLLGIAQFQPFAVGDFRKRSFLCSAYLAWAYEVRDSSDFGRLQCLSRWLVFAVSSLESKSVEKSPSMLTKIQRADKTRPRHSLFSLVGLVWISQDERLTETHILLVSVSNFSLSLERGVLSSTISCRPRCCWHGHFCVRRTNKSK